MNLLIFAFALPVSLLAGGLCFIVLVGLHGLVLLTDHLGLAAGDRSRSLTGGDLLTLDLDRVPLLRGILNLGPSRPTSLHLFRFHRRRLQEVLALLFD